MTDHQAADGCRDGSDRDGWLWPSASPGAVAARAQALAKSALEETDQILAELIQHMFGYGRVLREATSLRDEARRLAGLSEQLLESLPPSARNERAGR